jgi:hypothetical protein
MDDPWLTIRVQSLDERTLCGGRDRANRSRTNRDGGGGRLRFTRPPNPDLLCCPAANIAPFNGFCL